MTDDLAGEFQRVDAASDFAVFSNCLTLIDSLPFCAGRFSRRHRRKQNHDHSSL